MATLYCSAVSLLTMALLSQLASLSLSMETSNQTVSNKTVLIGAYVESLCPDSRRFIVHQLVPASTKLGDLFHVNIVPFGHARVMGNNRMICQHGERECDGNRKMACVLARSSDNQQAAIETLGCMFDSLDDWQQCVRQHIPNQASSLDAIDTCSKGEESYKMMIEAEKVTGRIGYVPKLTLNGKYDEDIQTALENDLEKTICGQYKGDDKQIPDACKSVLAS